MALGAGYLWASIRRSEKAVSPEFISFHRKEQMRRLKGIFTRRVLSNGDSASLDGKDREPR
jgi:hypothetical protein